MPAIGTSVSNSMLTEVAKSSDNHSHLYESNTTDYMLTHSVQVLVMMQLRVLRYSIDKLFIYIDIYMYIAALNK